VDHNGGLAPLLVTRWVLNGHAPLPIFGPPGTEAMVARLAEAYRPTELAPITIGGPAAPPIIATVEAKDMAADIETPQLVYQDNKIRVMAVVADHYHYAPGSPEARASRSYAYRIEAGGRVFVFTGDTGPSSRVEALAKGADILVTEVIDLAATERALRASDLPPGAIPGLLTHMEEDHLTPAQVGQLAARAEVKSVVLTHFAPGLDGERDLSGYTRGLGAYFKGPVKLARDLDRF
jgi:ribonuclease BN (tRNA processing enzyme)